MRRPVSNLPLFVLFLTLFNSVEGFGQIDSQSNLRSAKEDQDYSFAAGLYRDQLYQLSAEQFDLYLKKYPTSVRRPDALFLRGECSFFLNDHAIALNFYKRLLTDYPSSVLADDALFRTGQSQLALTRPELAVDPFKRVIDEHEGSPLAPESAYWLGEAYDRANDRLNALKYFTLAYEHFRNHSLRGYAMYAAGWTLQKDKKYSDAMLVYQMLIDSLSSDPLVPAAKVRVGECLYGMGEYRRSSALLRQVLSGLGDSTARGDAQYMLAESHYMLNELPTAAREFRAFLSAYPSHPKNDDATFGLAWTYLKRESYDSAAAIFGELAHGSGPKAHESSYRLASALRRSGKLDSAMSILRALPDRYPTGAFTDDALIDLADLHLRRKEYFHARAMAQRVVDTFPESNVRGDAFWVLGEANLAEGDAGRARPYFRQAMTSAGSGPAILASSAFRAATCAFQSGHYDTSAAEFAGFRSAYPNEARVEEAEYWQAESEYRRGDFKRSSELYAGLKDSRDAKRRADALYGLGWSEYRLGRYGQAAAAFGTVIASLSRGPMEYDARMRQADAYFAMKDYVQAEGAYRTVVRMYPDSSANDNARYQAAQCAFRRDDLAGAYKQFEDLVRIMPRSPLADDAQYAMGWVNFRRKQYPEAIKEFQKVISVFPGGDVVPRAYYSLGDGYYNLKQYPAAEKSYRELIRLFPESEYVADAVTGIQYCLQAQGKQDDALGVIDAFLAENKNTPAAQSLTLKKAEILLSRGDAASAKRSYESFLVSYPASALRGQAQYWLGKCEIALNDNARAFDAFRKGWGSPGTFRGPSLLEAIDAAMSSGRTDQAMALILEYEKNLIPSEVRPDVSLRKARVFASEGNVEEARRVFESILIDHPSHDASFRARLALARMSLADGRTDLCRSMAEKVAAARQDDVGAEGQYLVGASYASEKNWKEATTAYLRVRYVYPSSREWNDRAQLGLASVYSSSGNQTKAKESLIELLKGKPDAAIREEAERMLKEFGR